MKFTRRPMLLLVLLVVSPLSALSQHVPSDSASSRLVANTDQTAQTVLSEEIKELRKTIETLVKFDLLAWQLQSIRDQVRESQAGLHETRKQADAMADEQETVAKDLRNLEDQPAGGAPAASEESVKSEIAELKERMSLITRQMSALKETTERLAAKLEEEMRSYNKMLGQMDGLRRELHQMIEISDSRSGQAARKGAGVKQ